MQAVLPQRLFPDEASRQKAVSVTASIAVNLAMIVAFASIANIDGKKIKESAALVVIGLGGSEGDPAEKKAAPAAPPPPAAKPVAATPADPVQRQEKPLDQTIALLPPKPIAERSEAAAPQPQAEARPSAEEQREAAEQQRHAQEAAKARAAEQAQADAKVAAAAQAGSRGGASARGSGGYGALVIRHLQRFKRGNSVGAGVAVVRLSIDGRGGLQNVGIVHSSGSPPFDREAEQTVRRASPFPRPPEGEGRTLTFNFTGT